MMGENMLRSFPSHSSSVNGVVDERTDAIKQLEESVEGFLNTLLSTDDSASFSFRKSERNRMNSVSFNITSGIISSTQLAIIQRAFPGSSTSGSGASQYLLVPKSLAKRHRTHTHGSTKEGLYVELGLYVAALFLLAVGVVYYTGALSWFSKETEKQ